jgi:hypothetical protein
MPVKAREMSSRFGQVQKQAQQLLANLRREIRSKEAELRRLKDEDSKLVGLLGLTATSRGSAAASRANGHGSRAARIDWGRVLEQIPKQFKAADVHKVREVTNKQPSEIFAAIARWIEAKSVKRKERGLYERTQETKTAKTKKSV